MTSVITVTVAGETYTLTVPDLPSIGPISVSDPRTPLLAAPADANYVPWTWARTLGQDLDIETVMSTKLAANDILVLPEDPKPFTVKVDQGFMAPNAVGYAKSSRVFMGMSATRRGILGLGPGAVIDHGQHGSFTEAPQPKPKVITNDGVPYTFPSSLYKIFACKTSNAYFGNFTVRGRSFGGVAYSFLAISGDGFMVERLSGEPGSWEGFQNNPNGEAAFVLSNGNGTVRRLRANAGMIGTSPIMWNGASNTLMEDVDLSDARAGMPTYWDSYGTHTIRRMRSAYNGSGGGGLNGCGINIERTRAAGATFNIYDSDLIINYLRNSDPTKPYSGLGNSGLHLKMGSNLGSAKVNLYGCRYDKGPDNGRLSVQLFGYNTAPMVQQQLAADIKAYDANGTPLPVVVH